MRNQPAFGSRSMQAHPGQIRNFRQVIQCDSIDKELVRWLTSFERSHPEKRRFAARKIRDSLSDKAIVGPFPARRQFFVSNSTEHIREYIYKTNSIYLDYPNKIEELLAPA